MEYLFEENLWWLFKCIDVKLEYKVLLVVVDLIMNKILWSQENGLIWKINLLRFSNLLIKENIEMVKGLENGKK